MLLCVVFVVREYGDVRRVFDFLRVVGEIVECEGVSKVIERYVWKV